MDLDSKNSEAIRRVDMKLEFSYWLVTIAFTLLTFLISVKPNLVKGNIYLALQLSVSIPLYFSSIFARSKITARQKRIMIWERFGFFTFITAYGLLINVVGILLTELISLEIALYFWFVNILSALLYSFLEIYTGESSLIPRLSKDLIFIAIIVLFGILPVLKIF